MITIKFNPYQKGEFERYLTYAIKKKYEDIEVGKITKEEAEYDIDRINILLKIIAGKVYEDYLDTKPKMYREKYGRIKGDNQEKKREKIEII